MNPVNNPFTPGAGATPPALVGRDKIINDAKVAIERLKLGRSAQGMILVGLRGVGKTVLLERLKEEFQTAGAYTIWVESPESQDFMAVVAPQIREVLLKLQQSEKAKHLATRSLSALVGLLRSVKVGYEGFEISWDYPIEKGLADSGVFEHDLISMFVEVGQAAKAGGTPVVLMVDEIQYMDRKLMGSLIAALHRCTQLGLPVILFGAGLPQIRAVAGNVKSYTERMFLYPVVDRLSDDDAKSAIEMPVVAEGANVEQEALDIAVAHTKGYPYFLQEFGKQLWNVASGPNLTKADAEEAEGLTTQELDESFFRSRVDRLTPAELQFLAAMAELGNGPYAVSDIASLLGKKATNAIGPHRANLITKGMIWSPAHGDVDFTVPMFAEFVRRHYRLDTGGKDYEKKDI
ncbi:ATP-binding protein [Neisseria leonii]|uniref:ATP-binding protein n=1 Tax=Neisseria leonii TaxID=2995413 RepID=A0A9X4ID17_9NEIS|nr:ATP-binding protein [Neisseria sp. 51.81]MDD9326727.1 ATP-binding protein [Neisseria sp. 51.81]